MTATEALGRRAWIECGLGGGIRRRRRNPAIAPAPLRRPRGRQVGVERVPEARSHTPNQHGLWDRVSVTKECSGRQKAAGRGWSRVCSLEVRVMEVKDEMQGAGRAVERESAKFGAVTSVEKVG